MNKRLKKKKGYDYIKNSDLWGLYATLAKYILPRLIKFKEININSYPPEFKGMEDWHKIIDKMIWSFQKIIDDDWSPIYRELGLENLRYREGMNAFAEYFIDLWD